MGIFSFVRGRKATDKDANPAWRSILAFFSPGTAVWSKKDYATLSEAGYQNVAAVYGCVSQIARGAAGINWIVQKKTSDGMRKESPENPLAKRLWRPNEFDGKSRFNEKVIAFLLLSGNSYVNAVRVGREVTALYTLRPDRVTIKAGTPKTYVGSYEYSVSGTVPVNYDPADVLHLTEFHPTDDFYGLSRLEVAAKEIDISNWEREWNLKSLQNDMKAPGAVKIEKFLTDAQREAIQNDLKKYQGAAASKEIPIFDGGAGWINLAMTPKDMEFLNASKTNLRRICMIFNVASELLGDSENKTYSNVQEARRALYMEAILPLMDMFRDEMNNWIVPMYGENLVLDYDRDAIEAIQEERAKRYSYIAAADWLTVNEKRAATGYEERDEGDVIMVPVGSVPLEIAALAEEDIGEEDEKGVTEGPGGRKSRLLTRGGRGGGGNGKNPSQVKSPYWSVEPQRRALWDNYSIRVRAKERSAIQIAKKFLSGQAERVKDAIASAGSVNAVQATRILDEKAEAEAFAKAFGSWEKDAFIRAGEAGIRAAKKELYNLEDAKKSAKAGRLFQMFPGHEQKLYDMVIRSGTKIAVSTMEKVLALLDEYVEEGGEWGAGMAVEDLAQGIWAKLGEFEPWRARLIARTETAKIENFGAIEGYRQSEFVEGKAWLSAYTATTRATHIQASQTYEENAIPLDEAFEVGGELLQYPGDPAGSPGNVCNCLCTTYPVTIEEGEPY